AGSAVLIVVQVCLVAAPCCGGAGVAASPGPIPNPEAKPYSADGTAPGTVWESRTLPNTNLKTVRRGDPRGSPRPRSTERRRRCPVTEPTDSDHDGTETTIGPIPSARDARGVITTVMDAGRPIGTAAKHVVPAPTATATTGASAGTTARRIGTVVVARETHVAARTGAAEELVAVGPVPVAAISAAAHRRAGADRDREHAPRCPTIIAAPGYKARMASWRTPNTTCNCPAVES